MLRYILIAAAVIPAIFLLVKIYTEDRLEPEPIGLIISLVFLGIISTTLASYAERIGIFALNMLFTEETTLYNAILYFIIVGYAEEGFKYAVLRYKTWKNPAFNCQFDGVVYAVTVSLGFALWENIGYVFEYGLSTAALRAVTAGPGHACFGVFMGAWYGAAKRYDLWGYKEKSKKNSVLALVVPAFIHGCYDFIATLDADAYSIIFIVFVSVLFLAAYNLVKKLSREDKFHFQY